MSEHARIRVSLSAGELEVEGPDAFFAKYSDSIDAMLSRLKTQPVSAESAPALGSHAAPSTAVNSAGAELPEFGEVLHGLPSNASGPDRVLVAGWYVQQENSESTFSTGEANQLLMGQGVKLSNPSQALKNAIAAKRVFKVGSRYRVSKSGEDHLKTLLPH
jgi:hypothetical protein